MIIDALFDVLPRPELAIETGDDQGWLRVFRRVGTRLPEDYVQFIRAYGTGIINGYNWAYNPFAENENLNLIEQIPYVLSSFRALKSEHSKDFPFPLYFEPGGLLPWGGTIDGDFFFWETSQQIDHWPVVVIRRHDDSPERHDLPMSRFLAEVLAGRLKSAVFPDAYHGMGGPRFEPATLLDQSP